MNPTYDGGLKAAAQMGDINLLYTLIAEDPHVLEHIDSMPFVETPLHIAASFGQLQFATEVMRLKPSFARKLNPQGYSPIHLAMQQGQKRMQQSQEGPRSSPSKGSTAGESLHSGQERMVLRFVEIDKDLARVKGREGLTPLHFASQTGEVDLLASFLDACPESIKDVNVRNETALHIAVKLQQYEALQVLVGWLHRNGEKDAMNLEQTILNAKDEKGNTILHISALNNDSQALRLLVETGMDLNSKNLENSTTLDIATNAEIKGILCRAGAKHGSSVTAPTLAKILRSKITFCDQIFSIPFLRTLRDITEEQREAYLVVVALVVSATFRSAVSPPGGVYQDNAGDNNMNTNTTSLNCTAAATQICAGASVMSPGDFSIFSAANAFSLLASTSTIFVLTLDGTMGFLVALQVGLVLSIYLYSLKVISPRIHTSAFSLFFNLYFYFYLCLLTSIFIIRMMPTLLLRKVRNLYYRLRACMQHNN